MSNRFLSKINFFNILLLLTSSNSVAKSNCSIKDSLIIYRMDVHRPSLGLDSLELFESDLLQSVPDPHNKIVKAIKFKIKPNSYINNGYRSEAVLKEYLPGKYLFSYYFRLLIPFNFVSDTEWNVLAQWHDQPSEKEGQTWSDFPKNPPPLALVYNNLELYLLYRPRPGVEIKSLPMKVNFNTWNELNFNILWSMYDNGRINGFLNKNAFLDHQSNPNFDGPNIYNSSGNYFKFGIYRSPGSELESYILFKEMLVTASCISKPD